MIPQTRKVDSKKGANQSTRSSISNKELKKHAKIFIRRYGKLIEMLAKE